jgi:hypothetical protein
MPAMHFASIFACPADAVEEVKTIVILSFLVTVAKWLLTFL